MLTWALKYLKMGVSVIPLRPNGKEPLISWTNYQKVLPSESEVMEWWKKWPNANVGIVTGKLTGVALVDLDGAAGEESAKQLNLHTSVQTITGRGRHLWYRVPQSPAGVIVPNAVRAYPGLDIRGEGGYVVAPPSVHESGRRYRWQTPLNLALLKEFPVALLVPTVSTPSAKDKEGNYSEKPKSWIAKSLEGMKNGNIDDTLFTVCSRLRADNWSANDALVLLKPHADRVGATPGHLESKIENVWNRYEPNEKRDIVVSVPTSDTTESATETIEDFFKTEEQVQWICPGLIASNSLGFVVGLPETNKTWLLMDLAIEAAIGGKWLGVFPVKESKVWFIDQERFRGETQRRFKALLEGRGTSARELPNLRINSGNTSFKLDQDHSFTAFRKSLEVYRPDLVIVDSLATFHTKEENNRKDIQEVLERVKQLRNEFKCTFLFIHHENKMSFQSKEEGKEPSLAEMSGNIAIPAAAETVITVRKRIDDSSLVYHVKSTMSKRHRPFEIKVNDLDGPSKIEVRGYL